ncbi:MAG: reverse transcriptase N-terminal domain-containing protein [Methanoregula sp.]|nr:reverse transcriptase N-terminal domain-containing protein [Methanoregula sp.]
MFQRIRFPHQIVADKVYSKEDLGAMWNAVDWEGVREEVFLQQCRIARAALAGKSSAIPLLQEELVNSDEAKALAVWEVVHRKSKNSPGVDGEIWETPAHYMSAALHLESERYESLPLLRFFIPKESGKMRPIGIPAMHDRAMQMLYTFALQPVAETWGDPHSFGYRLYRSARDACAVIRTFLNDKTAGEVRVLDADITGCFDNIRHDWLLAHIPVSRAVLRQVLTSGYIYNGEFSRTSRGVPQGGILSPILANMTLDGLEPRLMKAFSQTEDQKNSPGIRFIRYADDFIVLTSSRSVAEEAWDEIAAFLKPRGLAISDEKTRIVPASGGFGFLHWRFQKNRTDVSVRPSDGSVHHFREMLGEFFLDKKFRNPDELIAGLNPLLRGYAYYHRDVEAGDLFRSLDGCIQKKLCGLLSAWFPKEIPATLMDRFFSPPPKGPPQFHTGTQELYLLSATLPGPQRMPPAGLNAFLDRDLFVRREEEQDPLDRSVCAERMRSRKEGQKYGVPEYW